MMTEEPKKGEAAAQGHVHECVECGQPVPPIGISGKAFARAVEERVVERLRGEFKDAVQAAASEQAKVVREVRDDIKPIREALDRELPEIRRFIEVEKRTERHRKAVTGMELRSARKK